MQTEVESRLSQSIHRAAFVNLGKEQQPQHVQRPWDMSVKVGEQRSVQLPPQTTILDVFDNPTISGKFLILGKPGGGKTTTLLELAEALIERADGDNNAPIPVILELSSWQEVTKREFPKVWEQKKYDPSIKEWVLSHLMSKGVSQEMGEQWLRDKELVLLLDGLDELQPERQGKCVRAINEFLGGEFSPLHLVVCSRKEEYEDYEEMLHLNGAICLEDLTNEQIRDYFASVNLGEFWESIKGSEKIVDFIRQPLFLAITSIAYQQIDVEEWKNCNTEEKAIDYLLGSYRVIMIGEPNQNKLFINKQYSTLKIQNFIVRIAKQLDRTYEKQQEFLVSKIEMFVLPNDTKVYFNYVTHILFLLILFMLIYATPRSYNIKFPMIDDLLIGLFFSTVPRAIGSVVIGLAMLLGIFLPFDSSFTWGLVKLNLPASIFPIFARVFIRVLMFALTILLIIFYFILLVMISHISEKLLLIIDGKNLVDLASESSALAKAFWVSLAIASVSYIRKHYYETEEEVSSFVTPLGVIFLFWSTFLILFFLVLFQPELQYSQSGAYIISTISSTSIYMWVIAIFVGIVVIVNSLILFPVKSVNRSKISNIFYYWMFETVVFFIGGFLTGFISYIKIGTNIAIENGLILGFIYSSLIFYYFVRCFALRLTLYWTGYLPWNITRFLDYCTDRLILQRVGNRYRFIHRLVQEHFAKLEIEKE